MTRLFTFIEIVLRIFGAWDAFLKYLDDKKIQASTVNAEDRQRATSESANAKTDKEIFENQTKIVDTLPKP